MAGDHQSKPEQVRTDGRCRRIGAGLCELLLASTAGQELDDASHQQAHPFPLAAEAGQERVSPVASAPLQEARKRFPRIAAEERDPCRKRALDEVDPDPYVIGNKHQMGRTHTSRPDLPSASANPQVVERVTPLQAEVGMNSLRNSPPGAKRTRRPRSKPVQAVLPLPNAPGWKSAGKRPALKISKSATGMRPETSEDAAKASPPPQPKAEDTGASHTGGGTEEAERAEPLVSSPLPKKKKKKKAPASSPSKTVPDSSMPASSAPAKEAPEAPAPAKTTPTSPPATSAGKPASAKPNPPEGTKLSAQELAAVVTAATSPSSGLQSLVLHAGRAAIVAGETASAQLGRITELKRGGADLGHLLDYAENWNQADLSPATRGLGKDKLPVVDPAGPRSTGQHFSRLRRAIREFDTAWHDANANVVGTLDTRKQLFEELLWEHRFLADAHSKSQAFPEASLEGLSAQLSALKAEKEQLALEHRKALDAQRAITAALKDRLMEAELRHARELKKVQATTEAKLDESLKEYTNATAVLRTELEEETVARKAAQDRIATLNTDQAKYDRLVMQIDALALRIFPDSQTHAVKKVAERRAEHAMSNPDAPWDGYDYLVALSARIQHMRSVDRHLVDLPDVAIQIFKVLWPGEAVPANITLTSDRLKDADAALRIACSWYEDLDLDAFHSLHGDAPTDKDPVLTAKRQDRAYRIAEFAHTRTFIPPPPDVRDALSDDEEEDIKDEEDEEAEEGDAAPVEGDAPTEAPEAGQQPPAV
nr:uncharacterized protein LOC127303820 [Lolium perenne]